MRHRLVRWALWSSLTVVALTSMTTALAQCEVSERQLLVPPPVGGEGQFFGASVGISGDLALVAATHDQETLAGEVYAYRRIAGQWSKQQRFVSSSSRSDDNFGRSIAMEGNVALIGAPGLNETAAYVFRFDGSTWIEVQKLVATGGSSYDWFGQSVALRGDLAVIGAPYDDDTGTTSGAAYVFRFDGQTWNQEAKLTSNNGKPGDRLGSAIATDGSQIMAGAPQSTPALVHLFAHDGSGWVEQGALSSPNASD